jgi:5-methylcytosine-specific restriction endonuclease McrA
MFLPIKTLPGLAVNGCMTRLDPESYEQLCQEVLQRDSWRCQACGTTLNLEVHHQQHRSQSGDDSQQNLITLCTICHQIPDENLFTVL